MDMFSFFRVRPAGVVAAALLILIISFPETATSQQTPRLDVVVPEADSSSFAGARHRFAGSTDPSNRAFVNGEEVKVYENGAFTDGVIRTE